MNALETASAMRRIADAVERAGAASIAKFPDAMLEGEAAVGAAGFLCYLRDCITVSGHDTWTREALLVLLETMSRDAEVFPSGIGQLMWNMEDK